LSADITVRLAPLRGAPPIGGALSVVSRDRVSARDDLAADDAVVARRFRDDALLERAD
jgi:hypothetical protein